MSALSELQLHALRMQISEGDLTGNEAHERVRPHLKNGRPIYKDDLPSPNTKKGAVLALFFEENDDFHLVFTVRKANLKEHSGQISFPGGRLENGEDAMQAALRECSEEIGIDVEENEVLGPFSEIYISASDFIVVPFVCFLHERPNFIMSEEEVEEIFTVPLEHLLNPSTIRNELRKIRGFDVDVPFYLWEEHKIWGATAAMLSEILDLIRKNI